MVFIGEGDIGLASPLFFIGNIGVSGSLVFYDSLLPHVAKAEETDRVSAAGYALGYIGGGMLLLLNLAWILQPQWFGFASATSRRQGVVPVGRGVVGGVLDAALPQVSRAAGAGRDAGRCAGGIGDRARRSSAWRTRSARCGAIATRSSSSCRCCSTRTASRPSSAWPRCYGAEIGIEQTSQIAAFVMVQFLGIPFAFLFGCARRRASAPSGPSSSPSPSTRVATVLGYFMTTVTHFFILAALVATVQGGAQALSRALFSRMIPAEQDVGVLRVLRRGRAVRHGAGAAGLHAERGLTGSSRTAVLAILLFFVAGAWVLSLVDEEEGVRAATE